VIGGESGGDAGEERERIDREREQQSAEESEPDEAKDDADDKHGVLLDRIERPRLPPPVVRKAGPASFWNRC
jgi:hypothetical protein